MRPQLLILLLLFIGASGCKTTRKAQATPPPPELITDETFTKPLLDKGIFAATNNAVPVDTAYITGDSLHIFTKKIQGCETENFRILWTGEAEKKEPGKTTLKLLQTVDASCPERHRFHLIYNIAPIIRKQHNGGAFTTIKLGGWRNELSLH
ncbi:MAG TPA: hypothetical protein VG603_08620 [Chitinophagales bacterium]|nr:hypothetical protein [Chitinophagales bacterium]